MDKWYIRKIHRMENGKVLDGLFLTKDSNRKDSKPSGLYYEFSTKMFFIIKQSYIVTDSDQIVYYLNMVDAIVALSKQMDITTLRDDHLKRFGKTIHLLERSY